eukprot:157008_1
MTHDISLFITLPIAIISAFITLITSFIAIFVVHHFFMKKEEEEEEEEEHDGRHQSSLHLTHPSVNLTVSLNVEEKRHHVPQPNTSKTLATPSPTSRTSSSRKTSAYSTTSFNPTTVLKYLSSTITIFNAFNTLFNSVYCIWLVLQPHDTVTFYAKHPAHTQR